MKRPSSPAQLALIDLPAPASQHGLRASGRPRTKGRRVSSWNQAQAANNALRSEELLARLAATPPALTGAEGPHAADRPHPPADAPQAVIEWRAEALADLFEAVQRAAEGVGNNVRRAAG